MITASPTPIIHEDTSYLSLRNSRLSGNSLIRGRVIKEILPDEPGRVAFDGTSWKACTDGRTEVAIGHKVLVLGRLPGTSMVMVKPL